MRVGSLAAPLLPAVVAALAGVAICLAIFGPSILDGRAIDWLMAGDRAQSFLGWHFYRRAPETFPLGGSAALLSPIGASLAYTDSFPWFSLALKPLSPLLPQVFQIAGLWLVLAYALQGLFAYLVLERLIGSRAVGLAGSLLIVASPVLVFRNGHLSLCAQWLILAAFYVFLRTAEDRDVARFLALWSPVVVLACGTHPYLAAMVVAIALAGCASSTPLAELRLHARVEGRSAERGPADPFGTSHRSTVVPIRLVAILGLAAASLFSFGYAGAPSISAFGFGIYSANVLTLIDPAGFSRLLPRLPTAEGQYEGFGFLGIAPLALFAAGAALRAARRLRATHLPRGSPASLRVPLARLRLLGLVIGAMAFFALSSRVLAGSIEVANLDELYARLEPLPSAFRSSGRFIWPLHYGLAIASIAWCATAVRRRSMVVALCLALLGLQTWDSYALYAPGRLSAPVEGWNPLRSYAWLVMPPDYSEIRLIPPYVHDASCLRGSYEPYFYIPFAYLAGTLGMRINSGHLSRQPERRIAAACRVLKKEIEIGHMAPDAVYVVRDDYLDRIQRRANARCGVLDGYHVCVRADRRTRFGELLVGRS